MMGCSIEADPNVTEARTDVGLVKGHAYSITKVVKAQIETPQASGEIPLIRIRNPWGNEAEWNGAWSDRETQELFKSLLLNIIEKGFQLWLFSFVIADHQNGNSFQMKKKKI